MARCGVLALGMTACSVLTDIGALQSRPDGGIPTEGGVSDGAKETGADTSTGRFCDSVSPTPTFCDDFDVGVFGAAWDSPDISGAGSMLGATMTSHTTPRALQAVIGGPSSSTTFAANLPKTFAGTFGTLDYAYWLFIVKKPTVNQMEVGDVGVHVGTESFYVGIILGSSDQFFFEHDRPSMPSQYMTGSITAASSKWLLVEWHLDFNSPSATLKIDGATAFSGALPSYGFAKGAPFIVGGVGWADKSVNGGEILVDDVVFSMKP